MNKIICAISLIGLIVFSVFGFNEVRRNGDSPETIRKVEKYISTFGDKHVVPLRHIDDAIQPDLNWINKRTAVFRLKIKIRDAGYMAAGRDCQDCDLVYGDTDFGWLIEEDEALKIRKFERAGIYGVGAYLALCVLLYGVVFLWRGVLLRIREISRAVRDKWCTSSG